MAESKKYQGKFTVEETEIIKEFQNKLGINDNQLVRQAIIDFIRNKTTINPYDSGDKIRADFEKMSQNDEKLRKKKKPGPRRIKKKPGRPRI